MAFPLSAPHLNKTAPVPVCPVFLQSASFTHDALPNMFLLLIAQPLSISGGSIPGLPLHHTGGQIAGSYVRILIVAIIASEAQMERFMPYQLCVILRRAQHDVVITWPMCSMQPLKASLVLGWQAENVGRITGSNHTNLMTYIHTLPIKANIIRWELIGSGSGQYVLYVAGPSGKLIE
jgi:hypothetical protein